MAILNFLSLAEQMPVPKGLWELLLVNVFDFVVNYGWRVVVFTICLKLLLSPLDVYQRITMKRNQKITERIKPEMDKLQSMYSNDKQVLSQKQMALNKREGFSYFSTCLPMIVTLAIFIWLFQGLTSISQYMSMKQYLAMYDTYETSYNQYLEDSGDYEWQGEGDEKALILIKTFSDEDSKTAFEVDIKAKAKDIAQDKVVLAYENELKVSFLWIKNVWSPDVFWKKPILEHDQFIKNIGKYATNETKSGLTSSQLGSIVKSNEKYNDVTAKLRSDSKNKTNGWLILPILSVGLSFLSQLITTRQQKKSGQTPQAGQGANTMKYMMFIMPIMMGVFALSYTSIFTIYIITNSAMTVILNLGTTFLLGALDKRNSEKRVVARVGDKGGEADKVIRYGRPDPNDKAPDIEADKDRKEIKKEYKKK